jgi:hypothetical protein
MSFQYAVYEDLTAVGTNINNASVLQPNYDYYWIKSSTANSGVKIPFCESGNQVTIINRSANTILAYPQPTGTIDTQAPGIPISLPAGVSIRFITKNGIDWGSLIDTTSTITPIITPNKVLGTDPSGLLIGIAGYSSSAGQASSAVLTDAKGEINASKINSNQIDATSISCSSVSASAVGSNLATINTLNNTTINSVQLTATTSVTTPLVMATNVTASGTVSSNALSSVTLNTTGNATIGGNSVVTGGIGCATCNTGALTVSGAANINSLTAPFINTSTLQVNLPFNANVPFSQNVTANAWAGVLKIGGLNMNPGQVMLFIFNNSFIARSNIVLLDTWIEFIGTTNAAPIYLKRSQDVGQIVFTLQNPGSNAYTSCVLVLQWICMG